MEGLSEAEAAQWRLQATLMKRLPQACSAAFQAVDADAQRRWPQRGGTTATLAVACGWELLVANVGDTCAYLDTGSEVLQVGQRPWPRLCMQRVLCRDYWAAIGVWAACFCAVASTHSCHWLSCLALESIAKAGSLVTVQASLCRCAAQRQPSP